MTPEERQRFDEYVKSSVEGGNSASEFQQVLRDTTGWHIARRTLLKYMKKVRERTEQATDEVMAKGLAGTYEEKDDKDGNKHVRFFTDRVITLDDAIAKSEPDLTRWDIVNPQFKAWEMGSKGPDGKPCVTPLFAWSYKLAAKKGWNPSEFRKLLLDDMKAIAPVYTESLKPRAVPPILAELSLFDAHFGKLAWGPETGQDYDIKICRDRYLAAGEDLIRRCALEDPERFLYVVGNDFFHADHKYFTHGGTPLDCDGRWQKAFRVGKDCCIQLIQLASQVAPVDVMIVPGNHDKEKVFCLGEVLEARFYQHPDVTVMNTPDPYNYYHWGKVLLGFVHGQDHTSEKKRMQLPQTMVEDRPIESAEAVWKEWHLGHLHSEIEDQWLIRKSRCFRTVTVRHLPSLSSTDAWHRESGYASVLAAEAHLYHKEKGRWAYLTHQVDPRGE